MTGASEPTVGAGGTDLPLVSIVTPTFRQGLFIEQTIQSVRAQSYQRIEHIVVDGGSTDDTVDILRRYEDMYDLHWLSEPDRGMYDGVNKGMALARGEILAYLNSDDLYFPWTVETAVRHLLRPSSAAIVYGDALWVDNETREARVFFQPPFRLAYLLTIGSFAQPATFWRRDVMQQAGEFDRGLQYTGDLDFFIRAATRFGAERVDEVLAIMRGHALMKSLTGVEPMRAENTAVRERYLRSDPNPAGIVRERARAWLARRRLWLRFAMEAAGPARSGDPPPHADAGGERPWQCYLAETGVKVSRWWLAASMLPVLGARCSGRAIRGGDDWIDRIGAKPNSHD